MTLRRAGQSPPPARPRRTSPGRKPKDGVVSAVNDSWDLSTAFMTADAGAEPIDGYEQLTGESVR